jgi:hypothetical protein
MIIMIRRYTVSQDGAAWYAHKVGFPYIPVMGSFGDKTHAERCAADMMGLTMRDWRKTRKAATSSQATATANR